MRITTFCLTLGLLLSMSPSSVSAQDEFDDFDDDFDAPDEEASSGSSGGAAAAAADEFGDLEAEADGAETADSDSADGDSADGDSADGDSADGDSAADGSADGDSADGDSDADQRSPSEVEAAQAYRERRHLLHNSWQGSVGGIHLLDAGSGAAGAFRAQLGLDFFFVDGWLTLPDAPAGASNTHSHIGGSLSLSWNPWDFIEFYASIASWANSNEQENPALFQVLGDTLFGVKAWYRFDDAPFLAVGGDLSIGFLNTVGDIGLVGDSTSAGLRANLTVDLRELEDRIPFIARLNVGYWFDNSSTLVEAVERARYNALTDPRPCPEDAASGSCQENRHLITRVERYSLQIDRVDRFRIGLGVEAPLEVTDGFFISPIAEWLVDIPVNRQGFSCLYIPDADDPDRPALGEDGCLDRQGGAAFEQRLTLGVRVLPPLRGMNIFVAVDIGLTGTSSFVRELSGQEPYNVRLGFGYAFDTVPQIEEVEREVVREVVREAEPDPEGRIVGLVVEQGAETPAAGAVIAFPGREFTSLSAGADGRFTTYAMPPGEVQLSITHPEFREGTCTATIPAEGGDVEARCELEALPRVGSVLGRVSSSDGGPVGGATVNLSGPAQRSAVAGPDGAFSVADLPPGTYTARVEAEGFLIKVADFEVVPRERATPELTLVPQPRRALVRVQRRQITIRRQVNFATDSADILPNSTALLSEIADVILRNPQITAIEIQGHTDNRGNRQHNLDLSQRRAEAVRDWLVTAGVSASRLQARGYGPDNPRVPNITASNRARNRRVQFMIQAQAE